MNGLTDDCIAIDANVFGHLTSDVGRQHIGDMFRRLIKDAILLLVDEGGRIRSEHQSLFPAYMKKADDIGEEGKLIRYWFASENHKAVPVNEKSELMTAIKTVVPAWKGKDRFYVYVAFKEGRILVTNDGKDIWKKRDELKRKTRKFGTKDADILTSRQAHAKL